MREHDHGRDVDELEYEGHPSAEDVLREVAGRDRGRARRAGRRGRATGSACCAIGDVALVAAVATRAPRARRSTRARRLVDEVKRRLPVWKRQVFADGTDEWVNFP